MGRGILPPRPPRSITFELGGDSWGFSKKVHEIPWKYQNFHNLLKAHEARKYKQTELSTVGQYSIKQNCNVFFL